MIKNVPASVGAAADSGGILGLGRPAGGGNGSPFHGQRSLVGYSPWGRAEQGVIEPLMQRGTRVGDLFPDLVVYQVTPGVYEPPWKKSCDQPRQHIKKQRHYFASTGPSSQSYDISSSHVWM